MKLPIIAPRPAVPRPVIARPSVTAPAAPARAIMAQKGRKAVSIPPEIVEASLKAEHNRILQNTSKKTYETNREKVAEWMKANKVPAFTVTGQINGEEKTVAVVLADTSRAKIDLDKLMEVSGLTIQELYDHGILATTKEAVANAIGATYATDATVAGSGELNATFKSA